MGEREIVGKDPAEIRRDIDDTRASIGDKLEALESQVKETAHDTVESVKSSALATYADVKKNFSLHHQVQERPWTMFGGAIGVGFVVGSLLSHKLFDHEPDLNPQAVWSPQLVKTSKAHANGHGTNGSGTNGHHKKDSGVSAAGLLSGSALMSGLTGILTATFAPELQKARQVAIGTVLGIVREIARDTVPASVADKTVQAIDQITRHLGGEPAKQSQRARLPSPEFATP